jgi:hypothetical protein
VRQIRGGRRKGINGDRTECYKFACRKYSPFYLTKIFQRALQIDAYFLKHLVLLASIFLCSM